MKRIIWNVTLASVLTLVLYIALYAFWGAILSELEDPTLKLLLLSLMTSAGFGFVLLYVSKIRKSVGEDEVMEDYREKNYISFIDDFKLIIKRESKTLICIAAIVLICFSLNTFDELVFEKKMISFPAFFFAPMCIFSTLFKIQFLGYALSAIINNVFYIIFLLLFRKRKYDYWMGNK